MTVSLKKLSGLLGLTERRINQLENDGIVVKTGRGKYDLIKSIRGYVQYQQKQIDEARAGGEELRAAQLKLTQSRAEIAAIEAARARGDAIGVAELVSTLSPSLAAIGSILRGIPKHGARELSGHGLPPREVETYLDKFIDKALNELSSIPDRLQRIRPPARGGAAVAVHDAPAEAEAEAKRVGRRKPRAQRRAQRRARSVGHQQG